MLASPRRRARFIAIEGIDGAGKSTIARTLATALEARLLSLPPEPLRPHRAPMEHYLAESPRARLLFYLTMCHAVSDQARRALAAGTSVVADRYLLSAIVHKAPPGSADLLRCLTQGLLEPDLVVHVNACPSVRLERISLRPACSAMDVNLLRPGHGQRVDRRYRREGPRWARAFVALDVSRSTPSETVTRILSLLEPRSRRSLPSVPARRLVEPPGSLGIHDSVLVGTTTEGQSIHQQTFLDLGSWLLIARLYDRTDAETAAEFLAHHVLPVYDRHGVRLARVLTDRGREFLGARTHHAYARALARRDVEHLRHPTVDPQRNVVTGLVHHQLAAELYEDAFARNRYATIAALQRDLDAWLDEHNHRGTARDPAPIVRFRAGHQ